jgi:hypothetical protein
MLSRGINSDSATPALLPGWQSVATGGNGSNQVRWRIAHRIDANNSITQIPLGADNSRPRWVFVARRAAVVQGSAEPGAVGQSATWPAVPISSRGNRILAGVYAQREDMTWVAGGNMEPIAVDLVSPGMSSGTSWGIWLSPAQTGAEWPGHSVQWFDALNNPLNQYYHTWAIELSPSP